MGRKAAGGEILFGNQHKMAEGAILELYVSNWRKRGRRRYPGSSRISLWHGCRSRLCSAELRKDAQHQKQANREGLQSCFSESQTTDLVAKQMRHA